MKVQIFDGKGQEITFRVGLVVSRFNEPITEKLLDGALHRLKERGFLEEQITLVRVPGAIEIPVVAQRLAALGRFEAIIGLGAVIKGETAHFDYVCEQVSTGCQQVALQNDVPVIFAVLTTENEDQAWARVGGVEGHKGSDAVDAAVETVFVLKQIR